MLGKQMRGKKETVKTFFFLEWNVKIMEVLTLVTVRSQQQKKGKQKKKQNKNKRTKRKNRQGSTHFWRTENKQNLSSALLYAVLFSSPGPSENFTKFMKQVVKSISEGN